MGLLERIGLVPVSRLGALESQIGALERLHRARDEDVATARKEIARLEGLLDGVGDPDRHLPGESNQGFYRSLSSSTIRDFLEHELQKVRRMSHRVYALRPDANDLIETPLDFLFGGDAIWPRAVDPDDTELQGLLDEIWTEPRNRLDQQVEDFALALLLDGELLLEAELHEDDGFLELAWIEPESLTGVVRDKRSRDLAFKVCPAGASEKLYFALNAVTERTRIKRAGVGGYLVSESYLGNDGLEQMSSQSVQGLAFGFFWQRPLGATRGRPDLSCVLDHIDVHDEMVWNAAQREALIKAHLLHVSAPDVSDKASGDKLLKQLGLDVPPAGPKVVVSNDKTKIEAMLPDVSASGFEVLERVVRAGIYGGRGFPEHWSGSGAASNLATAQAQNDKPMRRLKRLQAKFVRSIQTIIGTMLAMRASAGAIDAVDYKAWRIEAAEIGGKDKQRELDALTKLATSLTAMVSQRVISREAANEMFMQASREAGFQVDETLAGVPDDAEAQDGIEGLMRTLGRDRDSADDPSDREPRGAAAD